MMSSPEVWLGRNYLVRNLESEDADSEMLHPRDYTPFNEPRVSSCNNK